jgi:hypothetical protein
MVFVGFGEERISVGGKGEEKLQAGGGIMITIITVCTKRTFLLPPFCAVGMGILQHFFFLFLTSLLCLLQFTTKYNKNSCCLIKF